MRAISFYSNTLIKKILFNPILQIPTIYIFSILSLYPLPYTSLAKLQLLFLIYMCTLYHLKCRLLEGRDMSNFITLSTWWLYIGKKCYKTEKCITKSYKYFFSQPIDQSPVIYKTHLHCPSLSPVYCAIVLPTGVAHCLFRSTISLNDSDQNSPLQEVILSSELHHSLFWTFFRT